MSEQRSDARSDLLSRALMDHLVRAIDGVAAPRAARFEYDTAATDPRRMLRRDADGNVIGGIRSPWLQVPLARYAPHGTPAEDPAAPDGPDWTPLADRQLAAGLVGTMVPLRRDEVIRRYGDGAGYRARFEAAGRDLVESHLLLADDADELNASIPSRWAATG